MSTLRCRFDAFATTKIQCQGSNTIIKHIDCFGELNESDPNTMCRFWNVLQHNPFDFTRTTILDLSNLKMGDLHFYYLLSGMKLPSLQSFTACSNNLTNTSIALLCQKDTWPSTLQFLDLGKNLFTDTGFILLINFLSKIECTHPNINTLILRGNKFKDCLYHPSVLEFFNYNSFLQRVDLRQCELSYPSLEYFFEHIALNTTLRTFLIKSDIIQDVFCMLSLNRSSFFSRNTTLLHLTMPNSFSLDCNLSNDLFFPKKKKFNFIFNEGLISDHFRTIHQRLGAAFFHPNQIEPYLFTNHPFYTTLMSLFLCNDALPRHLRLPTHLLIFILSFMRPASYPFTFKI